MREVMSVKEGAGRREDAWCTRPTGSSSIWRGRGTTVHVTE